MPIGFADMTCGTLNDTQIEELAQNAPILTPVHSAPLKSFLSMTYATYIRWQIAHYIRRRVYEQFCI